MKAFLRENPTIAFGLGLPLLLVLVFLLISGIPSLLVDPPQHDVIYATEYYNYQSGVQISVVDRKVQVVYQGSVLNGQKPRIWRYNAKTGAVREVAYLLPPSLTPPGKKPCQRAIVSNIREYCSLTRFFRGTVLPRHSGFPFWVGLSWRRAHFLSYLFVLSICRVDFAVYLISWLFHWPVDRFGPSTEGLPV